MMPAFWVLAAIVSQPIAPRAAFMQRKKGTFWFFTLDEGTFD